MSWLYLFKKITFYQQQEWTKNFQMSKLGLEKEEELEIKLPTFARL